MRIAIVSETFTPSMGYIENLLPRELARLGHDVQVVAGNLTAYHARPEYHEVYEPFLGRAVQPAGVEEIDGFVLHRLNHRMLLGYPALPSLARTLRRIAPDVVQTPSAATWVTIHAALVKPRRRFALFTAAHQTPSVLSRQLLHASRWTRLRMASDVRRAIPGRLVAHATECCFAASEACAEVAIRFYGVPEAKVEVSPLGSDTDRFRPPEDAQQNEARRRLRERLGFRADDVVCIYTGRLTAAKDPLCLARAVSKLRHAEEPYYALFVGDGPQATAIAAESGCCVRPFVKWTDLPDWYRSADIGVWPRQESISMLDAAACGLPVVASQTMGALERIEGYGLTYREQDSDDLAAVLHRLRHAGIRAELGAKGMQTVREHFSWTTIARTRAQRYEEAVEHRRGRT